MRTAGLAALIVSITLLSVPYAYSWSGVTHESMCNALREQLNLTPDFTLGCLYPDQRGDNQNHICHEDFCPAERRAEIFLQEGRNFLIDGDAQKASFSFGTACHYISDALQPYHTQRSDSAGHSWFESLPAAIRPASVDAGFAEAVSEARALVAAAESLRSRGDVAGASLLASSQASRAAAMCGKMIGGQMAEQQKADVPECDSAPAILANKSACHLRDASLRGTLRSPVARTSAGGNDYTVFYIQDGNALLRAFAWGHIDEKDGDRVVASGIYYESRVVSGFTFENEFQVERLEAEGGAPDIIVVIIAAAAFFALLAALQLRWRLLWGA